MNNAPHKNLGFTLMEVMTVVAISGMLAVMGTPMLGNYAEDRAVSELQKDFVGALEMAREQAASTGEDIGVCPSYSGYTCSDSGWDEGWIVYNLKAEAKPGQIIPSEYIIQSLKASNDELKFEVVDENLKEITNIAFDAQGFNKSGQRIVASTCTLDEDKKVSVSLVERNGQIRSTGVLNSESFQTQYKKYLKQQDTLNELFCI